MRTTLTTEERPATKVAGTLSQLRPVSSPASAATVEGSRSTVRCATGVECACGLDATVIVRGEPWCMECAERYYGSDKSTFKAAK